MQSISVLRLFNVNSKCWATDNKKLSDFQKTRLMGTIARIFEAPLASYES